MNEQTSKFRLPVDAKKVWKKSSNKTRFVCLSAFRAFTPTGDWTRPETDCQQHPKEIAVISVLLHLKRGEEGLGCIQRDRKETRTCIKFSQMNIVTHSLLIAAPMPLKNKLYMSVIYKTGQN